MLPQGIQCGSTIRDVDSSPHGCIKPLGGFFLKESHELAKAESQGALLGGLFCHNTEEGSYRGSTLNDFGFYMGVSWRMNSSLREVSRWLHWGSDSLLPAAPRTDVTTL